jgi:hypothetical protein
MLHPKVFAPVSVAAGSSSKAKVFVFLQLHTIKIKAKYINETNFILEYFPKLKSMGLY